MSNKNMTNKKSIFRTHGVDAKEKPQDTATVKKENAYYMENYQATITVHKSPPQQRRQIFDYLEIDDETKEDTERTYPSYKLSKRKNLRVTFSDHIEVDVFDDFDPFDENYDDSDDDEHGGVVEETIYEIPDDRTKGLKLLSSSAEFKSITNDISPRGSKLQSNTNASNSTPRTKKCLTPTKSQSPALSKGSTPPTTPQPLLQKRKTSNTSLADLEKRTREYVAKLADKNKKAEVNAKVAKSLFPDITKKIHSQPNYKNFIANAKRAVEITRRYERPWVSTTTAPNQSGYHVWKRKSEAVHRTTSLPRNFRFADGIQRSKTETNMVVGDSRHRIQNS